MGKAKINADKLMKSGSGGFLVTQLQEHCHNYAGTSIEFISILVPAFFLYIHSLSILVPASVQSHYLNLVPAIESLKTPRNQIL